MGYPAIHPQCPHNAQHPERVDKQAVENKITLLNCSLFQWGLSPLIAVGDPIFLSISTEKCIALAGEKGVSRDS